MDKPENQIPKEEKDSINLLNNFGCLITYDDFKIIKKKNNNGEISNHIINILYQDYESTLNMFSYMAEGIVEEEEEEVKEEGISLEGGADDTYEEVQFKQIITNIMVWNKIVSKEFLKNKNVSINNINNHCKSDGELKNISLYTFDEYITNTKDKYEWSENIIEMIDGIGTDNIEWVKRLTKEKNVKQILGSKIDIYLLLIREI